MADCPSVDDVVAAGACGKSPELIAAVREFWSDPQRQAELSAAREAHQARPPAAT